jgi:hypothetical protein
MKFIMNNIKKTWAGHLLLAILVVCAAAFPVVAQTESDSTEVGKTDLSLELRYTKANNKTQILEVLAKTKRTKTYFKRNRKRISCPAFNKKNPYGR